MELSARNQVPGLITDVQKGAVNGLVIMDMDGIEFKALITNEAIVDLFLRKDVPVRAIIKASDVMFASGNEPLERFSALNQLAGTVVKVNKGDVEGLVELELPNGCHIKGTITSEAIEELELAEGKPALAIIQASDVIVLAL